MTNVKAWFKANKKSKIMNPKSKMPQIKKTPGLQGIIDKGI